MKTKRASRLITIRQAEQIFAVPYTTIDSAVRAGKIETQQLCRGCQTLLIYKSVKSWNDKRKQKRKQTD